jgi:hypothetical protein
VAGNGVPGWKQVVYRLTQYLTSVVVRSTIVTLFAWHRLRQELKWTGRVLQVWMALLCSRLVGYVVNLLVSKSPIVVMEKTKNVMSASAIM